MSRAAAGWVIGCVFGLVLGVVLGAFVGSTWFWEAMIVLAMVTVIVGYRIGRWSRGRW